MASKYTHDRKKLVTKSFEPNILANTKKLILGHQKTFLVDQILATPTLIIAIKYKQIICDTYHTLLHTDDNLESAL